jgi:uncharacterized protein (DUF58 family)
MFGALAVGHPEPALFAVPMVVLAIVGLVASRPPDVTVRIVDAPGSLVEGDRRIVTLAIDGSEVIPELTVDLRPAPGVEVVDVVGGHMVDGSSVALRLAGETEIEVSVVAEGWGRRSLGPIAAYVMSPLGMVEHRWVFDETVRMVSVPSDAVVNDMLIPRDTNLHVGDLVSKLRGNGSEFAELRPFHLGDDPKALNWRVSSRSGSLWVNERHPERNGDVVLVVDAQTQPGTGTDILVDRAVRLAGSLLREYGRRRYRLGLVTVDGIVRWMEPGSGEAHRRRVLEQLLSVQSGDSGRLAIERGLARVARRPALVIILTPLLDDSLAGLAHSMRVAGIDLAMIEVDPIGFLAAPTNEARSLGRRVWRMERDRLRELLAGDGIPVAPWREGEPPDVPIARIAQWRSTWRLPV